MCRLLSFSFLSFSFSLLIHCWLYVKDQAVLYVAQIPWLIDPNVTQNLSPIIAAIWELMFLISSFALEQRQFFINKSKSVWNTPSELSIWYQLKWHTVTYIVIHQFKSPIIDRRAWLCVAHMFCNPCTVLICIALPFSVWACKQISLE